MRTWRFTKLTWPIFRMHMENSFLKLCTFLLPDVLCLISTNPKGFYQPGSLSVEWVTPAKNTRSESGVVTTAQERVADFVVVNQGVYTVVGEIKTEERGGETQNLEQMVGLFQKDQKVMLGLVVNPTYITPQILVRGQEKITCYYLRTLPLDDDDVTLRDSLKQLAEMIVYFNSFRPPESS